MNSNIKQLVDNIIFAAREERENEILSFRPASPELQRGEPASSQFQRGEPSKITSPKSDIFEKEAEKAKKDIRKIAKEKGIWPASIFKLYEEMAKGKYRGFTAPAINIRTLVFDTASAIFRQAKKNKIGVFIFELARSEIEYTAQPMSEYVPVILAAAIEENFKGPLFFQGDHFQVKAKKYFDFQEKDSELKALEDLIKTAIKEGVYNIDIDASTLVDLRPTDFNEQQKDNAIITAQFTRLIRSLQPKGIVISVGGEIGEIGGKNSTAEELKAFMENYQKELEGYGASLKGLSKISVQTGAEHGGVILSDGTIKKVDIDFNTLEKLSEEAKKYGMAGAVQHGASTLPMEYFDKFPQIGTCEVHLATEFQNIVFDSPYFPEKLKVKIYDFLKNEFKNEWKESWSQEQFLYKTRKKATGPFKKEIFSLPEENRNKISEALEEKFSVMFKKLGVYNTEDIIKELYPRI